jgi:ABC-type spermidine/putrescine transport system permease subunit I
MQSKRQSLKETLTNTFTGMAGSFAITMLCLQVFTNTVMIAVSTTVLCTVWSIGRGYTIRRYFNKQKEMIQNGNN